LIQETDPAIREERKWKKPRNPSGVPVWTHGGILCTGETYQQVVKLTFARGARLPDPRKLFNASLEGNTRRAIDIREGTTLDAQAFQDLIRAAIAENLGAGAAKSRSPARATGKAVKSSAKSGSAPRGRQRAKTGASTKVVLLSGGNPQIAKADGDAPVQAYIAAMPGWKSRLGRRLDALIVRSVPRVRKAVRWNSPFYGIEGQGWFLSFHVLTRYVKVTFFNGISLCPIPPGGTERSNESRWIDLYEDDTFDEAQMAQWVKQAAALPGWTP
ncbi:MAG: DUF1801 domain-containing protein, partial [Planctomycetaceae bacterium]|nr:DUF1801 domain-containing protein [Planctomycetaceae bacterium]